LINIYDQIDTLLHTAQESDDQAERDAAIREATQLIRGIREQVEIARLPAELRYLAERTSQLMQ